jgi:Tfp pilus assembly protein PilO
MIFSSYKKHTTHIVLFILLLAMAGIVWYGIVPLKQAVYEKMRGIQEFYARRENREKQVTRLPELKVQYDAVLQNGALLDILIAENEVVDFVKTLENLASGAHIEMSITAKNDGQITEPKKAPVKTSQTDSEDTDKPSVKGGAQQKSVDILNDISFDRYLYLNIKVRGRYEDIVVFLHKMETLPIGLDVIRVEMKRGEVENTFGVPIGSGVNPFASQSTVTAEDPLAVKKDIFEAVFDVLVYVNK